jgi:hypothetical protein
LSPVMLNGQHDISPPETNVSSNPLQNHVYDLTGTKEQTKEELAIYHALKNDYQPGGHVERMIKLPTKTEPKPFHNANLETLLAVTSNNFEGNSPEAYTLPKTDTTTIANVKPTSTESKIFSTILSRDFLSSVSANVSEATRNRYDTGISTKHETHETTPSFHELGDTERNDEWSDQTSMGQSHWKTDSPHYQQKPYDPQQPPNNETMDNDNTTLFNVYASSMVSKPVEDPSLQSWFQSDFLASYRSTGTNMNSLAESNPNPVTSTSLLLNDAVSESSSSGNPQLQGWFKSEVINGSTNVDTTVADPRFTVNELEQARLKSITEALVLLRSLTEDQWVCFDLGVDQNDPIDHSQEINGLSIDGLCSKPPSDSVRIVDMLLDVLTADVCNGGQPLSSTDYNYSLARIAIATDVAPDEILALLMQTHSQMNELGKAGFRESEPNSITHEILLLALVRRFSAFHNAIDLIVSLSKDPQFQWSPKTLQAASELCERKDLLRMSRDLTNIVKTFDISRLKIPKRVFISLINVYKDNDARSDAIEMLKIGLKVLWYLYSDLFFLLHVISRNDISHTCPSEIGWPLDDHSKQQDAPTNCWMKFLYIQSNGPIRIDCLDSLIIALC